MEILSEVYVSMQFASWGRLQQREVYPLIILRIFHLNTKVRGWERAEIKHFICQYLSNTTVANSGAKANISFKSQHRARGNARYVTGTVSAHQHCHAWQPGRKAGSTQARALWFCDSHEMSTISCRKSSAPVSSSLIFKIMAQNDAKICKSLHCRHAVQVHQRCNFHLWPASI